MQSYVYGGHGTKYWAGTVYGSLEFPKLTFRQGVNLRAGLNKISLLSIAVGLPVLFLSLENQYLKQVNIGSK